MSGRRLSKEEKLKVVEFYNEEHSQVEVAKKFSIGLDYVRDIIRQFGKLRSPEENNKFKGVKKREFSKEILEEIFNYYKENSLEKTANKFSISIDLLTRLLRENNLSRSEEDRVSLIAESRRKSTREKYPFEEFEVVSFYLTNSAGDTCSKFHIQDKDLKNILIKNNIKWRTSEEAEELRRQTLLNRYGVEVPLHSPEIVKKKEKTTLEKYGVTNIGARPETKLKREATCLERYGDKIPSRTQLIKDKYASICIEKFGVKSPFCLEEIQNKRKQWALDHYGNISPFSSPEIFKKAKKTMLEKYGAENTLQIPEFRSQQAKSARKSSLEGRFEEFLIQNNFSYIHGYMVEGTPYNHEFDFAIFKEDKLDILVDCDGTYYHGYETDENGKSVNTYIDDYRSQLVPEGVKFLICLEGEEEKSYSEVLKLINIDYNKYIQEVFDWCREVDFPYPKYKSNILNNSYSALLKSDVSNFSMNARYGMKIIDHFHPSIWKANRNGSISPYEAWQKDDLLIKCIKNRIIYKGCNLDRSKVLAGFSINKIAPKVSLFNPNLAKYIVGKYLFNYNIIFDPCSGYSGRMLGVCSLGKRYIGQDINIETVKESKDIIRYFNLDASVECKDLLEDSGDYECLFTCPPYGSKEKWNQEIENKSCDEWIEEILSKYKCKEYIFVVDKTEKYLDYIVEELKNKSHFGSNLEYVIKISRLPSQSNI